MLHCSGESSNYLFPEMVVSRWPTPALWMVTIISALPILALGQSDNNTTTVSERVGWVSSGSGRSTSDILWGCFTIFLICSWKCVHLHVPSLEETEAGWQTTLGGWLPYWPQPALASRWLRKAKYMALVAIAPEVGVGMAVRQFVDAREVSAMYQEKGYEGFTMVHAFYANMGGFAIAIPNCNPEEKDNPSPVPMATKQSMISSANRNATPDEEKQSSSPSLKTWSFHRLYTEDLGK